MLTGSRSGNALSKWALSFLVFTAIISGPFPVTPAFLCKFNAFCMELDGHPVMGSILFKTICLAFERTLHRHAAKQLSEIVRAVSIGT